MGRLFVGNLSWSAGEDDLREHIGAKGIESTKVTIIRDRETGQSRGFAFVEIDGDVSEAISDLDGTNLLGRDIRASEAHERRPGAREGSGNRPRGEQGGNGFQPDVEHRRDGSPRRRRRRRDESDSVDW